MQVVDSSVLIEALIPEGRLHRDAQNAVLAGGMVAPELVDVEVVSGLRGLVRAGAISVREARQAVIALGAWPLTRRPHLPLLPRIWQLRDNLTAYDASYVALAEALGCPLVTADARLAAAPGARCEIVVLGA